MIDVPIISQDLRQDEVCIRAIRSFQYLDESIDKVFNKVEERITKNLQRLENISQR
jgi:Flp pilus assembly CpaE family ATPase